MTTMEIAAEHGVSRQSIHTYRRTGVFPQPVEGEGSTRVRFREDEVAAFFAANPKQPGKKRGTPPQQQGDPVSTTVDPRIAILSDLSDPPYNEVAETRCVPWDDAVKLLDAYRAAVIREAADAMAQLIADGEHDPDCLVDELRQLARKKPEPEE
jgi:predicted DNA-binding transcriptional regulator AlpA